MTLIRVFLPDLRGWIRNSKFDPQENSVWSAHPVFYYSVPSIKTEKGQDNIPEEIYFYKPVGSFIYYTHVISTELPEKLDIAQLKQEFNAIEIPIKLYRTNIQLTGTISK